MSKTLLLEPDFSTLRHAPWFQNEVFIFSDVYNDAGNLVEYAPRNILKSVFNPDTQAVFNQIQIKNLSMQLISLNSDKGS